MATVIDQLVVKLGLDSSDFKKGEKELGSSLDKARKGTEKTAKQMKDSGKDAAAFFGELQKSALKFMAALAAGRGLYNFVQNTPKPRSWRAAPMLAFGSPNSTGALTWCWT